ncbi:MAG: glycosyltransferase family 4 protein [Hyphomicrobiales bacterium]
MKIAFYAPLKPPDHPVPSGDRQMARMLIKALALKGHSVTVISHLRAYLSDNSESELTNLRDRARAEVERIARDWSAGTRPEIWLTYHPYYRAPDLLGPLLTAESKIPYVTLEASYARKRDRDDWANAQKFVTSAIEQAALNICFTRRDRDGLAMLGPEIRLAYVAPFIDVADYDRERTASAGMLRLIAVAMMRKGDKFDSYCMLAAALKRLTDIDWHLRVVGDGPLRGEVQALFAKIPASRMTWAGERAPGEIAAEMRNADLYCWPGCGEAYGLAYLEAQAAGVPVVAQDIAGVPEVVRNGETGILTPAGDVVAYADAIRALAADRDRLRLLGRQARQFVLNERTLEIASLRLDAILHQIVTHTPSPAHAG